MRGAATFALIVILTMVFAFGVLVESVINESEHEAKLYLTGKVQDQFETIQGLEQKYNTCMQELDVKNDKILVIGVK